MSVSAKTALTRWLLKHGHVIDRDAAVQVYKSKKGFVVIFDWAFDGKRSVRLSFSGVTPEERNEAMLNWLNGSYLPKSKRSKAS